MQLLERIRIERQRVGVGREQRGHERLRSTLAQAVGVEPDRVAVEFGVQLLRVRPLRLGDRLGPRLVETLLDGGANLGRGHTLHRFDLCRLERFVDFPAAFAPLRLLVDSLAACDEDRGGPENERLVGRSIDGESAWLRLLFGYVVGPLGPVSGSQ